MQSMNKYHHNLDRSYIMQGLEVLGPSGLQAPTSSWRLFGSFDFALHALQHVHT